MMKKQSGQVLIALVLILLTILTVGLIIIQRSTVDITTSTQNDQASRAFSAAEAGIETAFQSGLPSGGFNSSALTNNSAYIVTTSARLPLQGQALEYPPTGKGEIAQFWLVMPDTDFANVVPAPYYQRENLYIYFGDANTSASAGNLPAIEITLLSIDKNSKAIGASRWYYDTDATRVANTGNNFSPCAVGNPDALLNPQKINSSAAINGTGDADRSFKCRVRILLGDAVNTNLVPIMIRTRMLYVDNQPVAAAPIDGGASLPPQATIYTSVGTSGQARKTIQAFKLDNVAPFFFDYAIFSVADIQKAY